jgi:hypothetical protein
VGKLVRSSYRRLVTAEHDVIAQLIRFSYGDH